MKYSKKRKRASNGKAYNSNVILAHRKLIEQIEASKNPSNHRLAAVRVREQRDHDFLLMVVDDVSAVIKKILPSLDPEQGGLPDTDLSAPQVVERVLQECFRATSRHKIAALLKKRYVIGSRREGNERKVLYRSPKVMEMRQAVRFVVEELQYIRTEVIKEDAEQGTPMRRNVAAANAIAAMRSKTIRAELNRKQLRVFKPLDPDMITAHNSITRREVKLTTKLGRLAQKRVRPTR